MSDIVKISSLPTWTEEAPNHIKENIDEQLAKKISANAGINSKISFWLNDQNNIQLKTNAIAISATTNLEGNNEISRLVHEAGGKKLQKKCAKKGYTPTGLSARTKSYGLPAKYVIHAVGPIGENPFLLQSAYKSALQFIDGKKIRSIGFFSIIPEEFNYPLNSVLQIAFSVVRQWLEKPKNFARTDRIVFIIQSPFEIETYYELASIYFPIKDIPIDQPIETNQKQKQKQTSESDSNPKVDIHEYLSQHSIPINPKGANIFIGDLHGQIFKFKSLLTNLENYIINNISETAWKNATFVFLGDYIDKGKFSKELLEYITTTFIENKLKNQTIEEDPEPYDLTSFLKPGKYIWEPTNEIDKQSIQKNPMIAKGYFYPANNSRRKTFLSYGVTFRNRVEFMEKMPEHHKQFFRSLEWVRILNIPNRGYAICVHGGLISDKPVITQLEELFSKKVYGTIIQTSLGSKEAKKTPKELIADDICLISGHSYFPEVYVRPSRIINDTIESGDKLLTAVVFPPATEKVNSFLDGFITVQSSE